MASSTSASGSAAASARALRETCADFALLKAASRLFLERRAALLRIEEKHLSTGQNARAYMTAQFQEQEAAVALETVLARLGA